MGDWDGVILAPLGDDANGTWRERRGGALGDGRSQSIPRVVTGCLLSLLVLATLLGNALVCAVVVRFRHLRSKVTNLFVVSLALSDLFVGALVMPWKAVAEVAGFWPFGGFCDVWVAFDIMCSTASILNLCIISLERYWAFAGPFRHETRMSQPVAFLMIGLAWLLSILISFIPVQLSWHKSGQALRPANASEPTQGNCDSSLNRTYAVSSSLISFYIPVAIMVATYTRIYRIAQRQIRCISSLERAVGHAQDCRGHPCGHEASLKTSFRKETQVLKTLSIIMGVFVFCWLPFFVLNCLVPFCAAGTGPPCVDETTFRIFVWFGWTNSTLNPIIYAFNGEFRRAFATILGWHRWCANNHVEAVNFSNELASYHPDTAFQKDASTLSYPHLLPHAIQEVDGNVDWAFDKVSQISQTSRGTVLPCATAVHVECEPESPLGKIGPFTPSGLA